MRVLIIEDDDGVGALGPVEAYGVERLTAGMSAAGLDRVP